MKHRKAIVLALGGWLGSAMIAGGPPPANADAIEPHIAGARASLSEARRHLEALPRTAKRDEVIAHVQEALKGVDALGK